MAGILLIEDDPDIADFVQRGLQHHDFTVDLASTGAEGLQLARQLCPNLVILDLMLPDMDGIDICRQLHNQRDMGILILTARHLLGDRVRGLEAGADDYLAKPFAFEGLLARVRSVLRRYSAATQGIVQVGDLLIDIQRREVHRGDRLISLTPREFDLLKLLAENAGRPLRRETILQRIWGYGGEGDADPVKVYINYLRSKLNQESEVDLIHTLRGFGYVLKDGS